LVSRDHYKRIADLESRQTIAGGGRARPAGLSGSLAAAVQRHQPCSAALLLPLSRPWPGDSRSRRFPGTVALNPVVDRLLF